MGKIHRGLQSVRHTEETLRKLAEAPLNRLKYEASVVPHAVADTIDDVPLEHDSHVGAEEVSELGQLGQLAGSARGEEGGMACAFYRLRYVSVVLFDNPNLSRIRNF